jgi:hypothetical protein
MNQKSVDMPLDSAVKRINQEAKQQYKKRGYYDAEDGEDENNLVSVFFSYYTIA